MPSRQGRYQGQSHHHVNDHMPRSSDPVRRALCTHVVCCFRSPRLRLWFHALLQEPILHRPGLGSGKCSLAVCGSCHCGTSDTQRTHLSLTHEPPKSAEQFTSMGKLYRSQWVSDSPFLPAGSEVHFITFPSKAPGIQQQSPIGLT